MQGDIVINSNLACIWEASTGRAVNSSSQKEYVAMLPAPSAACGNHCKCTGKDP